MPSGGKIPPKLIICFGGDCQEYVWVGYQYVAVSK